MPLTAALILRLRGACNRTPDKALSRRRVDLVLPNNGRTESGRTERKRGAAG